MTYQEALDYINSIGWSKSLLGLERIKKLLKLLGNPEKGLKYIHIAGTNGKGSAAAMLSNILTESGYNTGLYTSPYVHRFNERIQRNGQDIPDEKIAELMERIRPLADSLDSHPTQFELITAMAFLYYKECCCDVVVLEVGLGGEYDATNVIKESELVILAAIGLDHMEVLGDSIEKIARTKAGIIKKGTPVISYGHNPEADRVIEEICAEKHSELTVPDFDAIRVDMYSLNGQTVSYREYEKLFLPLAGIYQKYNLSVVLEAVNALKKMGYRITKESVRIGLGSTRWPARFEVLSEKPVVIVDGGHNPHGVDGTVESLTTLFPGRKIRFLLGVMADKDYTKMLERILPIAEKCYTVRPDNPRALDPGIFAECIQTRGVKAEAFSAISEAADRMLSEAEDEDVLCAMGSLYMGADVKDAFFEKLGKRK